MTAAPEFDFSIGLCEFHPQTRIDGKSLDIFNSPSSDYARRMVFFHRPWWRWSAIGNAPARRISGWNAASWSAKDIEFFKSSGSMPRRVLLQKRHKNRYGFFCNIEAVGPRETPKCESYASSGIEIVPVRGGKDSAVTTELLRPFGDKLRFFTVNDQPARTQCILAGGYGEDRIIKLYRTIDPELLKRNAEGFLNGHTPFSSVVAFLSMYAGFITGADDVVLSNESSANESNIEGESVNHQYSKSFEFERDFDEFRRRSFPQSAVYFSLLRPF